MKKPAAGVNDVTINFDPGNNAWVEVRGNAFQGGSTGYGGGGGGGGGRSNGYIIKGV